MTLPPRPEMTEERFVHLGIVGLKHGWSYAERVEVITELSALREARRVQEEVQEKWLAKWLKGQDENSELRALVGQMLRERRIREEYDGVSDTTAAFQIEAEAKRLGCVEE